MRPLDANGGQYSSSKRLPTKAFRSRTSPDGGSMHPRSRVHLLLTLGKVCLAWLIVLFTATYVPNCVHAALEFATQGLARATSHRVLSPRAIPGQEETNKPRYSVPFFQNIRMDIKLAENVLDCTSFYFLQLVLSSFQHFLSS